MRHCCSCCWKYTVTVWTCNGAMASVTSKICGEIVFWADISCCRLGLVENTISCAQCAATVLGFVNTSATLIDQLNMWIVWISTFKGFIVVKIQNTSTLSFTIIFHLNISLFFPTLISWFYFISEIPLLAKCIGIW